MAKKKRVTFSFDPPQAYSEVKLCGSFTNWVEGAITMTKGKTGAWKAQVSLEPGEYEYKFIADGVWLDDPFAEKQVANDQGTINSLRTVSA